MNLPLDLASSTVRRIGIAMLLAILPAAAPSFAQTPAANPAGAKPKVLSAAVPLSPYVHPPVTRGDRMLAEYFRRRTGELKTLGLARIESADQWRNQRDEFRRQLREMLGLDPLPPRTDLKPVVTGRLEQPDFVVEKLHFQSSPGLYVTANLYLPKTIDKPVPAILYLCGHGGVKKNGVSYGNKCYYHHHGAWLARHGYACLTIDSLQLGEIEGLHHGIYREEMWWWNSRGYTPAGVEAWNCIRALDYLATRKEIDPEKFGATGRSGGGAYSWWIAALDERIKAAVPVAGITDLENHVVTGVVEGHCDCMYIVNTYRWDYDHVAALVAPRPLLISNTDKDRIFPLEGVARVHAGARRIYNFLDSGKHLGLQITEGDHEDNQELYTHAFVWFDRFLRDGRRDINGPAVKCLEPEQLQVFQKLPDDSINAKIHETFVAAAPPPPVPADAAAWAKQRDSWRQALREKVFRPWPEDVGEPRQRELFEVRYDNMILTGTEIDVADGVSLPVYTIKRNDPLKDVGHNTVILLDEPGWHSFLAVYGRRVPGKHLHEWLPARNEDALTYWFSFTQMFSSQDIVTFVPVQGVGPSRWDREPKRAHHNRRRYMLLGETLAAAQVWDVRRTTAALRATYPRAGGLTLIGKGDLAVVALYAGLLDEKVTRLQLLDLPASHRTGPDLLNVLRFLDIPQAVAMAAERARISLLHSRSVTNDAWTYPRDISKKFGWQLTIDDAK